MNFQFHSIVVGSLDPKSLASFWGRLLDLDVLQGEQFWYIDVPSHATRVVFRLAPPQGKGNISLELIAMPGKRFREQVDELVAKGAVLVLDRRAPMAGWAKLADPDGNEFFVRASEEELEEALTMVQG